MDISISIRAAQIEDSEAITRIHVTSWQESYKGIIADDYLDTISYRKRLNLRKKILAQSQADSLHLVAVVDDEIVAFCDAGPAFKDIENYKGEIFAIYVLDKYKRRGIGSSFIKEAIEFFDGKGIRPYLVWVLERNIPACGFYEKLDCKPVLVKTEKIGNESFNAIGYLFENSELPTK
jgi:GNAT superfamily N-acetyltransferase